MTEDEIQKALAFVQFNMACEGFELTEDNLIIGRKILEGKITGDEAVRYYIEKHGLKVANK